MKTKKKWEPWQIAYARAVAPVFTTGMTDDDVQREWPDPPPAATDRVVDLYKVGWEVTNKSLPASQQGTQAAPADPVKGGQKYNPKWPRLTFNGASFRMYPGGMYATFRAGDRWIGRYLMDMKEVVLLNPTGAPIGTADILRVAYLPLSDVQPQYFACAANPRERDMGGALSLLRDTYDPMFRVGDMVSVVVFQVRHP